MGGYTRQAAWAAIWWVVKRCLLEIGALLISAGAVRAGEVWVIADANCVNDGEAVWVAVASGSVFPMGEEPVAPSAIVDMVDRGPAGAIPLPGLQREDFNLAVRRALAGPGVHVIGCVVGEQPVARLTAGDASRGGDEVNDSHRLIAGATRNNQSHPHRLETGATQIAGVTRNNQSDPHRLETGATQMAGATQDADQTQPRAAVPQFQTEPRGAVPYSQTQPGAAVPHVFAKTIVSVEPVEPTDRGFSAPLGHELEILPLTNPCEWRVGQIVGVQVLRGGRPAAGVSLRAGHDGDEDGSISTATDQAGLASLKMNRAGHWFVLAEASDAMQGGTENLRATLTFRVRGEKDVSPALAAVRAIHGELDPAAVAGYRIGARAMQMLGLAPGSGALLVTHWTPMDARFSSAVDGLQAATRTSPGKMNLRVEAAPSAVDVQTVCTNRATGQRVVCKMRAGLRQMIGTTEAADRRDVAMRVAVMPDEWVFEISSIGAMGEAEDSAAALALKAGRR